MAYVLVKLLREDAIAVMYQASVAMVHGDRLTELLQRPGGRGMCRHIDVEDATGGVFHEHKDVKKPKGRRDHAKITGDDRLGMVAPKGLPAWAAVRFPRLWSRRFGMYLRTVLGDTLQTQLEQELIRNAPSPTMGSPEPYGG